MPLKIVRNNIINMEADAIVNTANHMPVIGTGVDMTIYKAAGLEQLLAEREKIGEIPYGCVKATPAFKLKAKYIFHAVTSRWVDGAHREIELLRHCYENIMRLAIECKCQSVAMPLLATGNNAYPKGLSLQIATEVVTKYLADADIMVYLVVYDKGSFTVAGKLFADIECMLSDNDLMKESLERAYYYLDNLRGNDYREKNVTRLQDDACLSMERYSMLITDEEDGMDAPAPRHTKRRYSSKRLDDVCCSSGPKVKREERAAEEKALCMEKSFSYKKLSGEQFEDALAKLLKKTEPASFSEKLFQLINERGMEDVDVYKDANMDRKLFSKVRRKNYKPSKNTVLALCFALKLDLDEAEELLKYAGFALAPNKDFDRIVRFCLKNEVHNIYEVNAALFKYTDETIN